MRRLRVIATILIVVVGRDAHAQQTSTLASPPIGARARVRNAGSQCRNTARRPSLEGPQSCFTCADSAWRALDALSASSARRNGLTYRALGTDAGSGAAIGL